MDQNKTGDFFNRPPKFNIKKLLWNPDTKQFLRRTKESWGKLTMTTLTLSCLKHSQRKFFSSISCFTFAWLECRWHCGMFSCWRCRRDDQCTPTSSVTILEWAFGRSLNRNSGISRTSVLWFDVKKAIRRKTGFWLMMLSSFWQVISHLFRQQCCTTWNIYVHREPFNVCIRQMFTGRRLWIWRLRALRLSQAQQDFRLETWSL